MKINLRKKGINKTKQEAHTNQRDNSCYFLYFDINLFQLRICLDAVYFQINKFYFFTLMKKHLLFHCIHSLGEKPGENFFMEHHSAPCGSFIFHNRNACAKNHNLGKFLQHCYYNFYVSGCLCHPRSIVLDRLTSL